jgi:hypothetical protein
VPWQQAFADRAGMIQHPRCNSVSHMG